MKIHPFLLIFFIFFVVRSQDPPSFYVDLDETPMHRYDHIVAQYYDLLHDIYKTIKSRIPVAVHAFLEVVFDTVVKIGHHEYAQEIEGIAKAMKIPATDTFILNCIYELDALCTSIVTTDPNGHIILARNLDFAFADVLRKIHMELIYTKSGHEVYRCAGLAGFVGGLTCMKPGHFAVSLNLRKMYNQVETMRAFMSGKMLVGWMIRIAVEKANDYQDVIKLLSNTHTVSGSYITIAGMKPYEGTILTRDRVGVINTRKLSEDDWFISQCNSDPWNATDIRSLKASEGMKRIGKGKATLENIANELLFLPPLKWNLTVAAVLMNPTQGYMKIVPLDDNKNKEINNVTIWQEK